MSLPLQDSAELKPCPFCDGAAEWNLGQKGDGTPWRYLACAECEAMGPHVTDWELSAVADDNDDILIAAWNRRAASPAVPSSVEAVRVTDEMVVQAGDVLMRHGLNAPEQVIYRAARAALEAALSRPSVEGAVAVKALEWRDRHSEAREGDLIADSVIGQCVIRPSVSGEFRLWTPGTLYQNAVRFSSIEAAKAAAQADYESRIRSTLVSQPLQAGAESELVERVGEDVTTLLPEALDELLRKGYQRENFGQQLARALLIALLRSTTDADR